MTCPRNASVHANTPFNSGAPFNHSSNLKFGFHKYVYQSNFWPGMLMLYLHGCWVELGRAVDAAASTVRVRCRRHAACARHEVLRARARLQRLLPSCIRLGSRSACPRCLPQEASSSDTSLREQQEGTENGMGHMLMTEAEEYSS